MKKILMIAYHFPPLAGSSGIQRTLRFVQHLPSFGWEPIVLTVSPHAYERTSDDLTADIPAGTVVNRAFGLDTARHLSFRGRYVGQMARPDRWVSWKFDGVRQGLQMIKEHKPVAIWSTYPIATAHLIGASLHRHTGVPWIVDFRDPMAQDGYPEDPLTRQRFLEIEAEAIGQSSFSLMTTPGAARMYGQRYPQWADKIQILENGYDEESFQDAESAIGEIRPPLNPGAFTFLHSGIIYPAERDPTQLIVALAQLKQSFPDSFCRIKFRFRAAVHDQLLNDLAKSHGVESCIETLPPIPYREALAEMLRSDGLLVMQAANCNDQVPAKIYEYLRAKKPILSLTDPAGDTATVLRAAGCANIADIANAREIAAALAPYLSGTPGLQLPAEAIVKSASRHQRTAQLARLLNLL